jgi:iron-regulated transporter 1
MRLQPVVAFALLLALAPLIRASSYVYDFAYDSESDDSSYEDLADYDEYNYYGDDDEDLYNEDGGYADDLFGYEEYYGDYDDADDYGTGEEGKQTCTQDKAGKFNMSAEAAACDIKIEGVDKYADLLIGGIDGVYKIIGCHHNKAKYQRVNSPPGEDRVMFSSPDFGDWDIAKALKEDDILMYGGDLLHHQSPLHVPEWRLGTDLSSKFANSSTDNDYAQIDGVTLKCADGQVVKPPEVNRAVQKQGPGLTPEEEEAKWKQLYDRYARRPEPNPTVNFSFMILLVMFGLSIVMMIPYAIVKRRPAKGLQPVANSFAQVIQQSKKKQSGHVN